MTEAQTRRFYFPAWNAAFAANWRKDRGCVVARDGRPRSQWLEQVEAVAGELAKRQHHAPTADDLRHACHVVALGRNLSSKDLENEQVERVENLFRLLQDPDNLDNVLDWQNPSRMAERRLDYSIGKIAPEAYTATVSSGIFGTRDWRSLTTQQKKMLIGKLKGRAQRFPNQRITRTPEPKLDPDNAPF